MENSEDSFVRGVTYLWRKILTAVAIIFHCSAPCEPPRWLRARAVVERGYPVTPLGLFYIHPSCFQTLKFKTPFVQPCAVPLLPLLQVLKVHHSITRSLMVRHRIKYVYVFSKFAYCQIRKNVCIQINMV